jgi:hypothetical protein
LRTQWVLFEKSFRLGTSEESDVILPDGSSEAAAEIAFNDGFWISPLSATMTIAEVPFSERTPIPVAVDLTVGDTRLRAEALSTASLPAETASKRSKAG